jgi:hypothetical protein
MEIIYGILGTILGWLLGLLSPSIIKTISDNTDRKNLKKIIFSDLKDLKKRLAPLSFLVLPKYGELDEKTFEWLKENSNADFLEGIEGLLKKGFDSKKIVEDLNQRGRQKNTHSGFKKMHLFAIDSHLVNLNLIDHHLMEKVLEVRFHVEAFNEDVDSFRESFKMTFQPGMTEINHLIISEELKNKSINISKSSRYIVDKINDILKSINIE